MRYFSPIFLRKCEHYYIRHGIAANKSPLATSVAFHGLVNFVPVRADNVLLRSFEPMFLGNPYPLFELPALDGSEFKYAFDEEGTYDEEASKADQVRFSTQYEQYIIGNIYIPGSVKSGDILLCSRSHPIRVQESPELK